MDAEFIGEKTYSVKNDIKPLIEGCAIAIENMEFKIGKSFLPGWYTAYKEDGRPVLYYRGNCSLWKNSPKSPVLPEILACSENEIIISKNIECKKYEFAVPSEKKDIDEIIQYIFEIAEMMINFNKKNLSVLYINTDSLCTHKNKIKLNTLPDICEINKKMYSPKDMVAPEVLRHEQATGKEGVYVLGLLAVRFLTGKNVSSYGNINISDYISNIKVPGFPQFIDKTLVQAEERFTIEDAFNYLKNIREERKIPLRFDIGMSSTVGLNKDRQIDEDSCGYVIENTLDSNGKHLLLKACLADGMGGMSAGEVASKAAVTGFLKTETGLFSELDDLALYLAWQANKNVFDELAGKDGGCTFTGVVFKNETFALAHVGDSRAYLWTGSKAEPELIKLTMDHSYVALMVLSGNMTEEEAKNSPDRNKILKSLGSLRNKQDDYIDGLQKTLGKKTWILENNDILIIICDGIWSEIEQKDFKNILKDSANSNDRSNAQYIADKLTALAVEKGAYDNASALIIKRIS
ncbi:MAG: PP2C family protein-serine/threonine phosphatase [bacterium]